MAVDPDPSTRDELTSLVARGDTAAIAEGISSGDRELTTEQLGLDSLGWMEFCISVELQSKLELTPAEIGGMRHVFEIEEWLGSRM